MKRIFVTFFLSICMFACKSSSGGGDPISEPEVQPTKASLVSPANNEPCNQGNVINNSNLSTVSFSWLAGNNTDTYTLVLTNLNNNNTTQENINTNSAQLNIDRNANYSWYIISKTNESDLIAESDTWSFYNAAEGEVNHVPFPAALISPQINETTSDTNITLSWTGSDNDGDITEYEIYLGTDVTNLSLQNTVNTETLPVSLTANTNYFWKVHTRDSSGNVSISSIFTFTTGN